MPYNGALLLPDLDGWCSAQNKLSHPNKMEAMATLSPMTWVLDWWTHQWRDSLKNVLVVFLSSVDIHLPKEYCNVFDKWCVGSCIILFNLTDDENLTGMLLQYVSHLFDQHEYTFQKRNCFIVIIFEVYNLGVPHHQLAFDFILL